MKTLKFNLAIFCLLLSLSFSTDLFAQHINSNHPSNQLLQISQIKNSKFKWMNAPQRFEISQGLLTIQAEPNTDFFIDPENGKATSSAPFLYKEVEGDFIATALVKPDFKYQWNACSIFMMIDNEHWIKFAFENSDATGKSIVSVVTREVSDDANGAILQQADQVWLKMIRKGNLYAMHWSIDGKNYKMCRLSSMPEVTKVKIGLEAQCPIGEKASHKFLYFQLESRTVSDLRKGE